MNEHTRMVRKELVEWKRVEGRCDRCHRKSTPYSHCARCRKRDADGLRRRRAASEDFRDKLRLESARRREKLIAAGLCTGCGQVKVGRFRRCAPCRRVQGEAQRRWRERQKAVAA